MTYPRYYIRVPFAFEDACVPQVIGELEIRVFNLIRRYVWRGRSGSQQAQELKREGRIYARISQAKLAEYTGRSRETVNRALSKLKVLGWLEVIPSKSPGPAFIVVGERIEDSQGRKHEALYFDAWMEDLWDHLEREARKEFGEEEDPKYPEAEFDPTPAEDRSSVRFSPVPWRVKQVRAFVGRCDAGVTEHSGCDADITGGVISTSQGVCAGRHTGNREEKEENNEGIEAHTAPAACVGVCSTPDPDSLSLELEQQDAGAGECVHMDAGSRVEHLKELKAQASQKAKKARSEQQAKHRAKEQKQQNLQSQGPQTGKVKALEAIWMASMNEAFPEKKLAKWGGKERGQAKKLLDKYDFPTVQEAVRYLIFNWEDLNDRILKGKGSCPNVGLLLSLHDVIVVEAQGTDEVTRAEKEIELWRRENPMEIDAPVHLTERLEKAKRRAGR